jgi:hypothetical protein
MKNTPHTPAPWEVDYSGNCHLGIIDKNDRTLAFCSLQNENGDEDEANARLIAAAPDLLSALERAVSIIEELPYPRNYAAVTFLEIIRKAKGEA